MSDQYDWNEHPAVGGTPAEQPAEEPVAQEAAPVTEEPAAAKEPAAPAQTAAETSPAEPAPTAAPASAPGWNPPPQRPVQPQQPVYPPVYGGYYGGYPNPGTRQAPPPPPAGQPNQWTFHDYGPLGGSQPPKPEKKPKEPKPPKPPKAPKEPKQPKEKGSGSGVKALAVVMCVLFLLSLVGFGGYIVYDLSHEPEYIPAPSTSTPTLNQQPLPDDGASSSDSAVTGKLTGNQIHQKVEPAVVGIAGYKRSITGYQMTSQGSGVVMTEDGYIVTNNHVISDESTNEAFERVEVILSDGDRFVATVVGKDKDSDLAVLKINATGLTAAEFGDSDQVQVGDPAYAIGNPSGLEFAGSFTGGYVSAVNRYVDVEGLGTKVEFIQTDAAINPGNSGGALVNEYGQVIGITSAKLVDSAYEGMGFAIPTNNVKPIVDSLIEHGWVRGRVQIGISYTTVQQATADREGIPVGLRVVAINEDSDVRNTRIQIGDIIYAMDGQEVYDSATIAEVLKNKKPGDTVRLSVYHVTLNDEVERYDVDILLQEKTNSEATSSQ